MGKRRDRKDRIALDQRVSRRVNGHLKQKERARRTARMTALIKKSGNLPYIPAVMAWLAEQLAKPSRLITQDEVNKLVGA
jgi:hypothetical protein